MAKLRVKKFGPIKDGFSENDGFMEITPVTVICGNQATGKSTIAKLYSTFVWLEKKIIKNNLEETDLFTENFITYCQNIGLRDYFKTNSEIEYIGSIFIFKYKNESFSYERTNCFDSVFENYERPKIMYVPSERNLLTVIDDAENIKNLPLMLSLLLEEYNKAKKKFDAKIFALPISNSKLLYDAHSLSTKILTDEGAVNILNASSGIQSVAPLSLVTRYLADEVSSDFLKNIMRLSLSERNQVNARIINDAIDSEKALQLFDQLLHGQKIDEESVKKMRTILHFFFNTSFINIVEEPEQNLYPESQGKVLFELLECMNTNEHNQLMITTHSPYMLSYLTQSAKAAELLKKGVPSERIEKIVPVKSAVAGEKISIYETKEDGSISLLKPYENLPSDANLLNKALADGNERFADLLDLEEEFCQ